MGLARPRAGASEFPVVALLRDFAYKPRKREELLVDSFALSLVLRKHVTRHDTPLPLQAGAKTKKQKREREIERESGLVLGFYFRS